MGDTMSKLRDIEEDTQRSRISSTETPDHKDKRFDLYFQAAITGVLASNTLHSDYDVVERAYRIAHLAFRRRG